MGKKHRPKSTQDGESHSNESSRKQSGLRGGSTSDRRSDYAAFISHSWDYDQEYARLVRLLNKADDFDYRNYSVPKDEKFDTKTDDELAQTLREKQIKPSSVVIVPAGVYSTHSEWIEKEISIAEQENKPILGVEPWGNDRTSSHVRQHADKMVGWTTGSVVDAIEELAP